MRVNLHYHIGQPKCPSQPWYLNPDSKMMLKTWLTVRAFAFFLLSSCASSTLLPCPLLHSPTTVSEDPPTVRLQPRYLQLQVGQPAEFRCIGEGSPTPTLEWTGGQGGRLSPEATFVDGVFRIPAVRRSDEAEYFCTAKNTAGSAQVRTIIYVSGGNMDVKAGAPPVM